METLFNILKKFLSKYKEILKKIFNKKKVKVKNINWELIHKLSKYDIVLVKMKKEDILTNNVKESHQTRPFLVNKISGNKDYINGYYFTSNVSNNVVFREEKNKGLKLVINKDNYGDKIYKNSLILYQQIINLPYENVIELLDHLSVEDLKWLKKYRGILNGNSINSNINNLVIEIGDIILENDIKYIIYQVDNSFCYGYPITKSKSKVNIQNNYEYIKFNDKYYFIDYSGAKTFKRKEDLVIVSRFNDDVVDTIKENKKKIKRKNKGNRR